MDESRRKFYQEKRLFLSLFKNIFKYRCVRFFRIGDLMMGIKYWIFRIRDKLFPPRTLHELWDWRLGKGKYQYRSKKRDDDLRKAWRRRLKD